MAIPDARSEGYEGCACSGREVHGLFLKTLVSSCVLSSIVVLVQHRKERAVATMLVRGIRQLVVVLTPIVLIVSTVLLLNFYDETSSTISFLNSRKATPDFLSSSASSQDILEDEHHDEFDLNVYGKPVHEVFSVSTKKGRYFNIVMGEYDSANPNILPHPTKPDTYFVIAQQQRTDVPNTVWFAQLVCEATFVKGRLVCTKSPLILPIGATAAKDGACTGGATFLHFNVGPHDARAFYGPVNPYIIYGSQSSYNCFGLLTQDLRILTDWGLVLGIPDDPKNPFRYTTELHRPPPIAEVEKNWFFFWDSSDTMYIHYDIFPKRVYAQLGMDGKPGPDLATMTAHDDQICTAKYMPKLAPSLESIHQATNSLKVTMCKRSDPTCHPTDDNTFIMTIFHHKTYYNWHGVYEPYVMLFKQSAPFGLHGISQKPIWIHGRGKAPRREGLTPEDVWEETEMFYVTSISWKGHGQTYHGYIDDVMFLSFGIEDQKSAAIDVVAADVLDHIGLCFEAINSMPPLAPVTIPESNFGDSPNPPVVDATIPTIPAAM